MKMIMPMKLIKIKNKFNWKVKKMIEKNRKTKLRTNKLKLKILIKFIQMNSLDKL